MRIATIAWALYLTVALTAFALHSHSPHEDGDRGSNGAATCALCIGHNVTGAVAVVAAFVLATPILCWRLQLRSARPQSPFVASIKRANDSRGPPAKVFLLNFN